MTFELRSGYLYGLPRGSLAGGTIRLLPCAVPFCSGGTIRYALVFRLARASGWCNQAFVVVRGERPPAGRSVACAPNPGPAGLVRTARRDPPRGDHDVDR